MDIFKMSKNVQNRNLMGSLKQGFLKCKMTLKKIFVCINKGFINNNLTNFSVIFIRVVVVVVSVSTTTTFKNVHFLGSFFQNFLKFSNFQFWFSLLFSER
jgi:hypothetical protein